MTIFYSIVAFIYGTIFGSFYNVLGERIPEKKPVVMTRSECPHCKHKLTPIELIPIISYVIQGGKCKKCKKKIPVFYPLFEIASGFTFLAVYLAYGFTPQALVPLTLLSVFLITVVSDLNYLLILDEVLIPAFVLLVIEMLLVEGLGDTILHILHGLAAAGIMASIKLMGDFMFKKESMGGGDIKLMFFIGLVLGWPSALMSVFVASLIGFPISLAVLKYHKTNVIPFGPFLVVAASILLFSGFDIRIFFNMLVNY